MSEALPPAPPRPPVLALRLGITGTRQILPDQEERIWHELGTLLNLIRREISWHAESRVGHATYLQDEGRTLVSLRFLSPLAEGADRLAARAAHDAGYRLFAPLPFTADEYSRDFATPDSKAEFRDMLAWAGAQRLEMDGARDQPDRGIYNEARSYEAAGRFVVRNCDLLIAIWDGKPPSGRGGTADMVRYASELGTPVWWIHATEARPPVWMNDVVEPGTEAGLPNGWNALRTYLKRLIVPPASPHEEPAESIIERATLHARPKMPEPHLAFGRETALKDRWRWGAHAALLRMLARKPETLNSDPARNLNAVAAYWHSNYRVPDDLSFALGKRYRSVYVWVFGLVALSLMFAALSLGCEAAIDHWWIDSFAAACRSEDTHRWITGAECAALFVILGFIVANVWNGWHARWIDYRLLAELYRKQQALAPLGWSLPGRAIAMLAEEADLPEVEPDRAAWVAWYFGAVLRAAPLPTGRFDGQTLRVLCEHVRDELVLDQRDYHRRRRAQYQQAGRNLVRLGELTFLAVLALVIWKLRILASGGHPRTEMEIATIVLPTFAAAFVGIRAYAELQLLAGQSRHMINVMEKARRRLEDLLPNLSRPLASQDLGYTVHGVATTMLQEVDGWARMFRVKVVDAA